MIGDLVESFFKRQINIRPGNKLLFFDQVDWVLGSSVFTSWFLDLTWQIIVSAIFIFIILHIIVKHIGYYMGLEEKKW